MTSSLDQTTDTSDQTTDASGVDALGKSSALEEWRAHPPARTSPRYLAVLLVLAAIYFFFGKLGLDFASIHPNATLVWPPTGIALAALLVLGPDIWPAIFAGALLVNLTTAGTGVASVGIAFGNTAEAMVGAYLVNRFAGGLNAFNRTTSAFQFIFFGAMLSPVVSATIGATTLGVARLASWHDYGSIWLTWWLGDATGALIVAPVLMLALVHRWGRWNRRRMLEALAAGLGLLLVSALVFNDPSSPLKFLCIPFVLWAAFRFGRLGTAVSVLILSGFAIWSVVHSSGVPLLSMLPGPSLLSIQAFMAVLAAMTLTVSTAVTERARAEEALRKARDELAGKVELTGQALAGAEQRVRFRETLLSRAERVAHAGSFQWDARTNRIVWSDGLYRVYGRTPAEFGGTLEAFLSYIHPEDRETLGSAVDRAMRERQPFRVRERVRRPNGEIRVLDSIGEPLLDAAGQVVGLYGVCRDITSEYESEQRLLESEERWRLLVDRVQDHAIVMLDVGGHIASWNEGAERIEGYRAEEIIGQHVSRFHTPDDVQRGHDVALLKEAESEGHVEDEGWRVRKDGSRYWAFVSITALRDDAGQLQGFAKVTRDLTERRQAELALSELSGRILRVQDEEQRRIAQELHDSTSPLLTALTGKLYAIKRQVGDSHAAAKALDDSLTLAEHTSTVIRNTRSLLHPALLDQGGLLVSLRWYLEGLARRTGLRLEMSFPESLARLPRDAEIALFRIVEECLANVVRHSASKAVWVTIVESKDAFTLEVRDSGHGIPSGVLLNRTGTTAATGIGIRGMAERAKQLGGRLEIDSGNWGTRVRVTLPPAHAD